MSQRNQTSEVEARIRSLFLILRPLINDSIKAEGLPRTIAEGTDSPLGLLFHVGNRAGNLDKLTGPNVAQGRGVTIIWPDAKGVETKRQCGTVFLPSGLNDDLTAANVILNAMLTAIIHTNAGTDRLPELVEGVAKRTGLTKAGKLTKALQTAIGQAVADLGPWPVPGLVKATVKRTKQGHRGPVKAYCSGVLNADGEPCMVENERANPSKYWRAFHPSTAAEEIPAATCHFCGGPMLTAADLKESRKNREVTEEIEI